MKVRVSTSVLAGKVDAAKQSALRKHQQQVDAYPAAVVAYRARLVKALEKALRDAKAGKPLPEGYARYRNGVDVEGVIVDVGVRQPTKPSKPDLTRFDKRTKELRLTSATDLLVDPYDREWFGIL